jgi:outer membrane protein assembly factor BamD (BamD/ComL family)
VFSNQLRRVHTQISRLTESEGTKPDEGLYAIGEKYLKLKRFSQAKYVFSRYLEHYPAGPHADQARKNLQLAEEGLPLSDNSPDKEKQTPKVKRG